MKPTNVKVYSTTTCPYCIMEKKWLESEKIKHEIIYVDQNMEEAQKMVNKTGQMGVPVTEITYENGKEEFVIGFDQHRLSHILKN
jgi:glutaredoxin 3